jgi:hypothetical protein
LREQRISDRIGLARDKGEADCCFMLLLAVRPFRMLQTQWLVDVRSLNSG